MRLAELEQKHRQHGKVNHPMTKDQLEGVWEEQVCSKNPFLLVLLSVIIMIEPTRSVRSSSTHIF